MEVKTLSIIHYQRNLMNFPSHIKSLANKNILVNTLIIGVTKTKIHKKIQSKT